MKKIKPEDIIGKKFNKLTILDTYTIPVKAERYQVSVRIVKCLCECGNTKNVRFQNLQRGITKSCGCIQKKGNRLKHGHGNGSNITWRAWQSFKNAHKKRQEKSVLAKHHTVSYAPENTYEPWACSFIEFLKGMGERPSKRHRIKMIDISKGYYPGNCEWREMNFDINKEKK